MQNNYDKADKNITPHSLLHSLINDNEINICRNIVCFTLNWGVYDDILPILLELLEDKRECVRDVAVTCIGHTARIFRKIDKEQVNIRFNNMIKGDRTNGRISDANDDIRIFT